MNTAITLTDADAALIAQAHVAGRIDANYMTPQELKEFARMTTEVQPCCYIGCDKPAEWADYPRGKPYADTYACSDHLGHLLDESPEHIVVPIGSTPEFAMARPQ